MKMHVALSDRSSIDGMRSIASFKNGKSVFADISGSSLDFPLKDGRHLFLFGEVFYHIKVNGSIRLVDSDSIKYLKDIFNGHDLRAVVPALEGQYIGLIIDPSKNTLCFFSDRYARVDSFYAQSKTGFYFATDLDYLFKNVAPAYDQKMLAHIFSAYGWYAPKGLTIYKGVKQLKVGEVLTVSGSGIRSEMIVFKPLNIEDYTDSDLETYYRLLRDSVISRANRNGKTWISSSSGWDSSMLLGMLVNELGPGRVGMLSGSMKYSRETQVINRFEIDKIKKIGKFYGIKPQIVDFNFKDRSAAGYMDRLLPYYRSKHMYTFITYNFTKLSEGLTKVAGKGETIFNGETSDSFHNFGFSQFGTFFHTKKVFTEYADKMNCYLYGPSFFKKVLDGTFEKDKVFQIFKRMSGAEFEDHFLNLEGRIESYLMPFFYGGPRIPFAKTLKNPVLTENGQKAVYKFPFREFMPEVITGLRDDNIYSWLIYMYHSFHSQGSTVNVHKHGMEYNGHRWRSPFNDYRIIDFLSKAPEKWGRGLELNNTKYPLKWVARNKIKFPYELLEEGPHSYLYDVIEGFSLVGEITYRSGVTDYFKGKLAEKAYRGLLDERYFDVKYLDKLSADFLNGKEVRGVDFNNLISLIILVITGWY